MEAEKLSSNHPMKIRIHIQTARALIALGSSALPLASCSLPNSNYFAADPATIENSRRHIAAIDRQDRVIAHEERMSRAEAHRLATENTPKHQSSTTIIIP